MTPFEVRLELLKLAAQHASDEYSAGQDRAKGRSLAPVPYPSINDIISRADALNEFVSRTQPNSRR